MKGILGFKVEFIYGQDDTVTTGIIVDRVDVYSSSGGHKTNYVIVDYEKKVHVISPYNIKKLLTPIRGLSNKREK